MREADVVAEATDEPIILTKIDPVWRRILKSFPVHLAGQHFELFGNRPRPSRLVDFIPDKRRFRSTLIADDYAAAIHTDISTVPDLSEAFPVLSKTAVQLVTRSPAPPQLRTESSIRRYVDVTQSQLPERGPEGWEYE